MLSCTVFKQLSLVSSVVIIKPNFIVMVGRITSGVLPRKLMVLIHYKYTHHIVLSVGMVGGALCVKMRFKIAAL